MKLNPLAELSACGAADVFAIARNRSMQELAETWSEEPRT